MKELVVISGKGGTGKTSLTAAFSFLADNFILCDADVDAPDLHLILHPEVQKSTPFSGGSEATINPDLCTDCGRCLELCQFDAVNDDFTIDGFSCEGCGVCFDHCPENAISFEPKICGRWYVSDTRVGPMVHAALGIAEENSGKLVSHIKNEARDIAKQKGLDLLLTDGSPGVGCPVIASISGASAVLIIAEPSVSGLHDMARVAELAAHFKIPAFLSVNKYDLNPGQATKIEYMAAHHGVTVLGRIPFDKLFVTAVTQGQSIYEACKDKNSPTLTAVREVWNAVLAAGLKESTTLTPITINAMPGSPK